MTKRESIFDRVPSGDRNFGSTEIAPLSAQAGAGDRPITLEAAFAACANFQGGVGIFGKAWEAVTQKALIPSYTLLCCLQSVEEEAWGHLSTDPFFAARTRGLRKSNLALAVFMLTAKPSTAAQRKLCSDHACVLIRAAGQGVKPSHFAAWVSTITLEDCVRHVRELRRNAKAAAKPEALWLKLRLGGGNRKALTYTISLTDVRFKAGEALFRGRTPELADAFLRALDLVASASGEDRG